MRCCVVSLHQVVPTTVRRGALLEEAEAEGIYMYGCMRMIMRIQIKKLKGM